MIISRISRFAMRLGSRRMRMFSSNKKREEEVEFYTQVDDWWDLENGKLKSLHWFNRPRMQFIKQMVDKQLGKKDFSGMKMLDIGCGGGILSESLARLGAQVTGIDPTPKCIEVAESHAKKDPSLQIQYLNTTLQQLIEKKEKKQFDLVCLSQVIQHIDSQEVFVKNACSLVKPGGGFFLSTLNKNTISYIVGIVLAQYIAGVIPRGTHDWNLFVTPETISKWIEDEGFEVKSIMGIIPGSIKLNLNIDFKLHPSITTVNFVHFSQKKL